MSNRLSVKAHIFGGLGNQLFQFAAGRQLSARNDAALLLDLSRFNDRDPFKRQYSLNRFNVADCNIVTGDAWQPPGVFERLSRGASQLLPLHRRRLILERDPTGYIPLADLRLTRSVTIDGYWQNERYFDEIAHPLRRELTPAQSLSSCSGKQLDEIRRARNSVSIHVRRLHNVASGPAARPDSSAEAHGLALTERYYRNAVERMSATVDEPEFFVFSDFDDWARRTLSFAPSVNFVSRDERPDYEDLWLMAQCRHHIIANSSFSWWGAWLAEPSGGMVIAPTSARLLPNIPLRWNRVSSN